MPPSDKKYRLTRLAPTPSGYLHLGNAYSFLVTAALAGDYGAEILLRIDDMDRERKELRYVHDIFDTLHFLNIEWTRGPASASDFEQNFSQAHRLPVYNKLLERIVASGRVYACKCSRSVLAANHGKCRCRPLNLDLEAPGNLWRLDTGGADEMDVLTLKGQVRKTFPSEMENFIVRKRDGFPSYQVCSLADDVFFGVDLIVRGEDLWPSTLAQLYLARLTHTESFLNTTFHHHTLLMNAAGEKLSKSKGDTSVKYWREKGKTRKEILAMISHLKGN